MDLEFNQGYLDYQYVKTLESHEPLNLKSGWPKLFFIRCILYGFSSGAGGMMSQSFSTLNVPLMDLFNRTSVQMFGINDGGSLLLSITTWIAMSGMLFSISILIPLIDYFGRKFICVYLKFSFTFVGIVLIICSWIFQNALFYLAGLSLCVVSAAILGLGDPLFITEIAPKEHKGFFTASVLAFAGVFNGACLVLAREDIWGNREKWIYIAVLAGFLNLFVLMAGSFLPDSTPDRNVDTIIDFYREHFRKFSIFFKQEKHEKNKIFLLISMQIFLLANICMPEGSFPIPVYREEGLDPNQVLSMILVVFLFTIPTTWFGPMLINKLKKPTLFKFFFSVLVFKALLHIWNSIEQLWILSYLNVFCHRLIEGSGFPALTYLVAIEILPKEFVVTAVQSAMFGSSVFIGTLASVTPFAIGRFLQIYFLIITAFSSILIIIVLRLFATLNKQTSEKKPLLSDGPPPEYSSTIEEMRAKSNSFLL